MRNHVSVRLITPRFAFALGISAIGFIGSLITNFERPSGFGVVRAVLYPQQDAATTVDLESRLNAIHNVVRVDPRQNGAWEEFIKVLLQLNQMTLDYKRRLATGERFDEMAERTRHTLILGAAMNEIEKSLSPEQVGVARSLIDDLTTTFICKGLPRE